MLRIGCIILSVWGGLHFIASALSLIASILGKYAPMMKIVFSDNEIEAFDTKILSVTKALAIMHNSGATIFGAFVLSVTWFVLNNAQKWSFWTLLLAGVLIHLMWFLSDSFIGNKTFMVNVIFSILFLVGISISGYGLFKG